MRRITRLKSEEEEEKEEFDRCGGGGLVGVDGELLRRRCLEPVPLVGVSLRSGAPLPVDRPKCVLEVIKDESMEWDCERMMNDVAQPTRWRVLSQCENRSSLGCNWGSQMQMSSNHNQYHWSLSQSCASGPQNQWQMM